MPDEPTPNFSPPTPEPSQPVPDGAPSPGSAPNPGHPTEPPASPPPPAEPPPIPDSGPNRRRLGPLLVLLGGGIVVIALVVFGAVTFLGGQHKSSGQPTAKPSAHSSPASGGAKGQVSGKTAAKYSGPATVTGTAFDTPCFSFQSPNSLKADLGTCSVDGRYDVAKTSGAWFSVKPTLEVDAVGITAQNIDKAESLTAATDHYKKLTLKQYAQVSGTFVSEKDTTVGGKKAHQVVSKDGTDDYHLVIFVDVGTPYLIASTFNTQPQKIFEVDCLNNSGDGTMAICSQTLASLKWK